MLSHTYLPQPPLSDFVSLFWLYERNTPSHARERVLPTGTVELVINLSEDSFEIFDRYNPARCQSSPGTLVSGPYSEFFILNTARQSSIIGVHFKPGGAFPFFKLPADELRDSQVSLAELWGAVASELRGQLLEAPTPQAKFQLLEQFLLAQAALPLGRHPAVAFALREFQDLSHLRPVSEVVEQIGLSSRRFSQVFSQEVGLTPKLFWRVRRFQEVLHLIGSRQPVEWQSLALNCGYFDQAHFIHDFQAFSGLTPTAYLAHRSEHLNHVPLFD